MIFWVIYYNSSLDWIESCEESTLEEMEVEHDKRKVEDEEETPKKKIKV